MNYSSHPVAVKSREKYRRRRDRLSRAAEEALPPAPRNRESVVRALWRLVTAATVPSPGLAAIAKTLCELMPPDETDAPRVTQAVVTNHVPVHALEAARGSAAGPASSIAIIRQRAAENRAALEAAESAASNTPTNVDVSDATGEDE